MNKRILWITPKWPLPAHDGARIATSQLIQYTARLGLKIDLLSIVDQEEVPNESEIKSKLGIQKVYLFRKPPAKEGLGRYTQFFKSILSSPQRPITIAPYASPQLQNEFMKLITQDLWDTVVFDGLHTAALYSTATSVKSLNSTRQWIYRAHNVEADLWTQSAKRTRNFLKKWLLFYQARQVACFEQSLIQAVHMTATVSQEDLARFKKLYPKMNGTSIPIGIETPPENTRTLIEASSENTLIFLGKLDWAPNVEGLKWFLTKVWPKVHLARPTLKLKIAGKGQAKWLETFSHLPNVEILGFVENTTQLYQNSILSIIPIFIGSGTRVKVIESSIHARATLSTALGVEGTGLQSDVSYLRAENENEWISNLVHLNSHSAAKMGQKAFDTVSKNFSPQSSAKDFAQIIVNNRCHYAISR